MRTFVCVGGRRSNIDMCVRLCVSYKGVSAIHHFLKEKCTIGTLEKWPFQTMYATDDVRYR